MSTTVSILGSQYSVANQSDSPPWGADLHDTIVALANALNTISGPSDIELTTFSLGNNVSSPTLISGAAFDVSQVRSFIIQYSLYRSTNSVEEAETGTLYGVYYSVGNRWDLSQTYGGSSGISFTISNSGQLYYTSSNLSGTSYSGTLKFKAQAFLQ